jgi:osmotically-inducible protein OsmY
MVFLRGRVNSYYLKQLAQETIRNVAGVEQIVNEIEVVFAAPP